MQGNQNATCLQQDGAYLLVGRGFSLAILSCSLGIHNELKILGVSVFEH